MKYTVQFAFENTPQNPLTIRIQFIKDRVYAWLLFCFEKSRHFCTVYLHLFIVHYVLLCIQLPV
jgi:hypothetical protein